MENVNECSLRKLRSDGRISEHEYLAGSKWRDIYLSYLASIGAPAPYGGDPENKSDEECEALAKAHKRGCEILKYCGRRVLHSVNSIAVYEEPRELGDFNFTLAAAKIGLSALAREF